MRSLLNKILPCLKVHRAPILVKTWLISWVLVSVGSPYIYSQYDSIKEGAYRNIVDFHKGKTILDSGFILIEKYNKKIPNFYKIEFSDELYDDNSSLIKSIFLIYSDNQLYINLARMHMINGYVRIEKIEKYCYFRGRPMKTLDQESRTNNSSILFGLSGALITQDAISKENKDKVDYVLNLESGMINLLTVDYLGLILSPYPELLFNYNNEATKESIETRLKYLKMINIKNHLSK